MGITYRFLATVAEGLTVLDWFRMLPELPGESALEDGSLFYFPNFGQLVLSQNKILNWAAAGLEQTRSK